MNRYLHSFLNFLYSTNSRSINESCQDILSPLGLRS